jgi:hypothetical protein
MKKDHTVVAAFSDRETAQDAIEALHAEGFHKTWIGVTSAHMTANPSNGSGLVAKKVDPGSSLTAKIGRFFSGDSDDSSLTKSLTKLGVPESEAQRIDGALEPRDVLLTVDGSNHPELAAQIIRDSAGDVLSGNYKDAGAYALDESIDGDARVRLRNERLGYGTVPTLFEETFVCREYNDEGAIEGTRSMGGAVGSEHVHTHS